MLHRIRSLAVVPAVCLVLVLAGGAIAQQRPQFSARVELVQLQVGVGGPSGGFIRGLTADDFVVVVDGDPRPAQVAYEVDLRSEDRVGIAAIAGPGPTRETRPISARRHLLLFFDFSFTSRRGVLEARRAALEFIAKDIRPSDVVAVATSSRYGIQLLSPFTGNFAQIDSAVRGLGLVDASDTVDGGIDANLEEAMADLAASNPVGDTGGLEAMPAIEFREYVSNVSNYTSQLKQFGQMLQAIEGRKHVIMFSRGFQDRALAGADLQEQGAQADARASNPAGVASSDPEMMWGAAEVREGMLEAVDMFRNADAVIHAIDPTGIDAGFEPGNFTPTSGRVGRQALTYLTDGTGGEAYWNLNDLSTALTAIDDSTASFYLIAYRKESTDPDTVKIEVQVQRRGVRVTSAPSRLTPPPTFVKMNEMQRQLQLAELMAEDGDRKTIAFDSQVTAFPATAGSSARAALVLEINGLELDRLATLRGTDDVQLELAGFALNAEDVILDEFRRRIRVDVAAMRAAGQLHKQAFRYSDYVDVPPGEGRLRLLIREAEVGELSAATRGYFAREIAPDEGVVLVRPLVVDNVTVPRLPDPAERFDPLAFDDRRFAPIASPSVRPGDAVVLLVVSYNLPLDPATGAPQAGLVLDLDEGNDGNVYRLRDFEIIGSARNAEFDVTRLLVRVVIPAHARAGDASLWTQIIDQAGGERREEQTRLFLSPE
jgi:VWFA-related protein